MNGEYRKIHKVLGATNKNKDLRNQVKEQVDERIENQLTIGMNLTINPVSFSINSYFVNRDSNSAKKRRCAQPSRMTSREILSKSLLIYFYCREPVDKVYFRRRDEESMYAEAMFKNKIMLGKK